MENQNVEGKVLEEFNWIGRLRYDEKGYMSVQLMELDRPHLENLESSEEIKQAFEGFMAYYGTYDVDHKENSITHHLEGSMHPNYTSLDLKRYFNFFDNKLELKATLMNENDTEIVWRLIWERLD